MSVEKIIAEHIGCDLDMVKDDSKIIEDLGADSLDIVELVMQLEEQFDIEIPDEDSETLVTVSDVKQYIEDNS